MSILSFVKKWTLPVAICIGTVFYLLFSSVEILQPVGDAIGPILADSLPYGMFLILYVTFCKIKVSEMKPRPWHLWLQVSRVVIALLLVWAIVSVGSASVKLVLEGAFVCVVCPTAAAAAVVTEKLGGSIASLTVFTIIDNLVTSLIIPLLFPLVEKEAHIPFLATSLLVLRNVASVLVAPLVLALLTRKLAPRLNERICRTRNFGFYMWCFNLAVVTGLTVHNIIYSSVTGIVLAALLGLPLVVAVVLFSLGKSLGRPYGENISGGQALGQKNTVVAIWLTVTFLNPLAAVGPGAYVIWQNMINSWQLWYKEKYGTVKW
ncbi:MAG: transporter [Prevotella sp.]|nr:transporter [Prevotella sp.]